MNELEKISSYMLLKLVTCHYSDRMTESCSRVYEVLAGMVPITLKVKAAPDVHSLKI
jgi:hypothetical protein